MRVRRKKTNKQVRFEVICVDGVKRHKGFFAEPAEAAEWAWNGHFCVALHEIRQVTA
jgi:hypothetical protein